MELQNGTMQAKEQTMPIGNYDPDNMGMVTVGVDAFDEEEAYEKAIEEVDIVDIKDNLQWNSF